MRIKVESDLHHNFADFLNQFYKKNPDYLAYRFAVEDSSSVFHITSGNGQNAMFKFLYDIEPRGLEWLDRQKMTPLFYAVRNNQLETVKFLISLGAELEHADKKQSTPFYQSVLYSDLEILKTLYKAKCNINHQNHYQRSSLMKAIYLCKEAKTEYLLGLPEIDIHLTDSNGRTVLHMACWGNGGGKKGKKVRDKILDDYAKVIPALLEKGADVSAKDRDGNSPLMISCSTNSLDSVKFWFEHGFSFEHINNFKENPLMIAARYGNHGRLGR